VEAVAAWLARDWRPVRSCTLGERQAAHVAGPGRARRLEPTRLRRSGDWSGRRCRTVGLPAADASIDAGDTGFTGSLFG